MLKKYILIVIIQLYMEMVINSKFTKIVILENNKYLPCWR